MYTVRLLLGIVCLVNACGHRMPDGHLLTASPKLPSPSSDERKRIVSIALSQLEVREIGRNNYGPAVKKYLAYVGLKEGSPWCAALTSWVFGQAGYPEPRTAWSPALFPLARNTFNPKPADLVGFYYTNLGRIAHCGILESRKEDWLITIEGNTSIAGSRDGDGVQRKRRHLKTIAKFADWVAEKGVNHGR